MLRPIFVVNFCITVALAANASADLYHYWPLEEGAGTTTANLGTSGDGPATISNVASGGLGTGGNAWITADAVRGTVISGNNNNSGSAFVTTAGVSDTIYNNDWTITGWVSLESSGGNDVILGNRFDGPGGGWAKLTPSNYEWRPGGDQGNVGIANIPEDGSWHQHTIVKSGNSFQYYLDGVPGASDTFTGTFSSGTVPFFIGGDDDGERPGGRYDEVGFFNEALSAGKAAAMYNFSDTSQPLGYNLQQIDSIFGVFDGEQDSFETDDGLIWQLATAQELNNAGLGGGNLGEIVTDGESFGVLLDSTSGVIGALAIPEPASIAIWSLIGVALVGFGWYHTRMKK